MSHFLLSDHQIYIEETYSEVRTRCILFGNKLYDILRETESQIFKYLKFYQAVELLEKTTWGEVETENS